MHGTKMQGPDNDYLYVYGEVPQSIQARSNRTRRRKKTC